MPDPSVSILSFKPDNPCNTSLVNEEGVEIYAVHTDFTDEAKPTTRVNDVYGKCIAEWVWRDVRSDLLTFKDKPQIPASAWLHKSLIPFNRCGPFVKDRRYPSFNFSLSDVTFEDGSGRKYKWKNVSPGVYPQVSSSPLRALPLLERTSENSIPHSFKALLRRVEKPANCTLSAGAEGPPRGQPPCPAASTIAS